MAKECPTCEAPMDQNGISRDVRTRGGVQGVDIAWWTCPECGTKVDDMGNVATLRDQQHARAWIEYAHATGDWTVLPWIPS